MPQFIKATFEYPDEVAPPNMPPQGTEIAIPLTGEFNRMEQLHNTNHFLKAWAAACKIQKLFLK